ncbi:MAG: copper chaperone PCu(A)C [Proteobacteria bacterium]|nr:MAG: copper chaperone PCu(A)C [Pseudomonadota bacterium]QKK12010.1 MAG: copper chaperone PCu(A)C [Pseudomonadota bacterium]
MRVLKKLVFPMAMVVTMSWAHAVDRGVVIESPWIREAPPTAKALAGYMKIRNHSSQKTLVSAESDDFQSVMLHQTVTKDGMAMMIHRQRIELPKGVELIFEPGGYHLMLLRPKRPLRLGDQVAIDLVFSDGTRQTVEFTVSRSDGNSEGHAPSGHR